MAGKTTRETTYRKVQTNLGRQNKGCAEEERNGI
jgi:hypothetical protein